MIKAPVLTPDELDKIIQDTIIHDRRHKHYDRTVSLARLYKQLMTGNTGELLVSYRPRESHEQKTQRVALTNSATKHICGKIMNQFKEVDRVDNVVDNLFYEDEQKTRKSQLEEIHERLQVFHKNEPIKNYLDEAFKHLAFYDPNAWIIIEIHPFDPIKAKPFVYPIEVYSDQAINYNKYQGVLQWLVVRHAKKIKKYAGQGENGDQFAQTHPVNGKPIKLEDGFKFTIYGPDHAIVYDEMGDADDLPDGYEIRQLTFKDKKVKTYAFKAFDTKSKVNPAITVGYIPDPETNRETYVGILDPAEKILKDIDRSKSEYDMANALHGYLQKFMYGQKCDNKTVEGSCKDGAYATGKTCEACKGTGMKYHSTVQDIILIRTPETKEEHIPLSDFVHYVEIPETLIDRHKLDVEKYEKDVAKAIFNVNVFDRSEIAVTATEKKLDLRNIYNVFSPFADKWSAVYKHCVYLTAIHLQADEKLIIEHKFPSDFKLDTVDELLEQRKAAKDAGSPYEVIRYIDLQILAKQNVDNAETVQMVEAIEYFKPFKSKSENEVNTALSQLPAEDESKILWLYWDRIFRNIEIEQALDTQKPPFHKIPVDQQYEVIKVQVTILQAEIKQRISQTQVSLRTALNGQQEPV